MKPSLSVAAATSLLVATSASPALADTLPSDPDRPLGTINLQAWTGNEAGRYFARLHVLAGPSDELAPFHSADSEICAAPRINVDEAAKEIVIAPGHDVATCVNSYLKVLVELDGVEGARVVEGHYFDSTAPGADPGGITVQHAISHGSDWVEASWRSAGQQLAGGTVRISYAAPPSQPAPQQPSPETPAPAPAPAPAATSTTVGKPKPSARKRTLRAVASVKALPASRTSGVPVSGKVRVVLKRGGRTLAIKTLPLTKGRAVTTFRKLRPGTYTVHARYLGTATHRASTARRTARLR